MAKVVKRAIYGRLPSLRRRTSCSSKNKVNKTTQTFFREDSESSSSSISSISSLDCSPRRREEYLRYEESSSDEEDEGSPYYEPRKFGRISRNFADLVSQRDVWPQVSRVDKEYGARHLLVNDNFKEKPIRLGEMNKIFCSMWLNDRQVVFGSKCNKLSVYDTAKREIFSIPLLRASARRQTDGTVQQQCGIHSMAINPSQTVLATGGENANDVAFYSLPTFDPLAVGEGAHQDWMFDLQWLDDAFLVSGSRDTTMALWKLPDDGSASFRALSVKKCKAAEKVRALAFNRRDAEVAALSLNGYIHLWKADRFKQMGSQKLHHGQETVCLAYQEDHNVYAVGSRSHTTVLDGRSLQPIQNKNIASLFPTCGIRSVSFRGDILTIGTGTGTVLFYDLRASKYMTYRESKLGEIVFRTSTGWVAPDDPQVGVGVRYSPAVYTHCYDETGTRLFAAGGPLAVEKRGNYAAIWS